jgi:cytoskeletal protein RodZ
MDDDRFKDRLERGPTPEETARAFIAQGGFLYEEPPGRRALGRFGPPVAAVVGCLLLILVVLLLTGSPAKAPGTGTLHDPPPLVGTTSTTATTVPVTTSTTTTTVPATTSTTTTSVPATTTSTSRPRTTTTTKPKSTTTTVAAPTSTTTTIVISTTSLPPDTTTTTDLSTLPPVTP